MARKIATISAFVFVFIYLLFLPDAKGDNAPVVVIVGGGPAGIAAATKLLENNITNVIILEAEGRIGGRVYSVQFGDAVVDLGAQWCHGKKNNVVYELAKNYDLLESIDMPSTLYHSTHEKMDKDLTDDLFKLFSKIYEEKNNNDTEETTMGLYFTKRYSESVYKKYGKDTKKARFASDVLDYFIKMILSTEGAFSIFDVAAKMDYMECEGSQVFNWKGHGYGTILDILMGKYPDPKQALPIDDKILLNKEVVKIVWDNSTRDPHKATLQCLDGSTYVADHIILTPSLGVLKDRYKTMFYPQLPQRKIKAIKELGIAAVGKVFFHFPVRWWPLGEFVDFSFIWSDKDAYSLLQEYPHGPIKDGKSWLIDLIGFSTIDKNPNVLSAWFCGKFVPEIELLSDQELTNGVMFVLNKFVGHLYNLTQPNSLIRSKWYSNRHFLGTYSYQTVDSRKSRVSEEEILSEPLTSRDGHQTLLFAGEATHPIYYSTVHGAIETGHREANRIINVYKERTFT